MVAQTDLAGSFILPGTSKTVNRMGYGAMQLAGPGVWGSPRDVNAAIAVLRQAVESGVNHIDTSDYYGPHVTNQLIHEALHPYPDDLVIVTKVGARRGSDGSVLEASSPEELIAAGEIFGGRQVVELHLVARHGIADGGEGEVAVVDDLVEHFLGELVAGDGLGGVGGVEAAVFDG